MEQSGPETGAAAGTLVARFPADEANARRLAEAISERFGAAELAATAFEAADTWMVEIAFAAEPDRAALRAFIAEQAPEAAPGLVFERVAARDWVAASLADLPPVHAGRFVIHGSHDRARVPRNRIGIEIEAALAFGTGHHGTTRGCLLALDALLKTKQPRRVLDIGTGSGILAIAAAHALRRKVLATDIDPAAIRVARDNAGSNRAGALIEIFTAAGANARRLRERAPYDLIFANILLGPLKAMAAPAARLLAPGGRMVLSGLLPAHANAAIATCGMQRLVLERRLKLDGWVTLVMRRPARRR